MKAENADIVIIGAGLTGLTAAYYLKKLNRQFVVVDRKPYIGGVIRSQHENGFIYEMGPNTGVISNTYVVELFDDLSASCTLQLCNDLAKKRYILKNGKWHHLPMGLIDAIKCPLFTLKDKFGILAEPFRSKGKNPHENLSSFVRRRLGESFLKYAVDPFILGVYAGDPNYLIPKYALPKLYNLEQDYGSFIKGSIKKKFIKKTELEKRVSKKVFSFKGGMSSLTNALFDGIGKDNFILGAENLSVQKATSGYIISFKDQQGQEQNIQSQNIITTIGAYELGQMFPFIGLQKLEKVESLKYTKVIEVSVGFKKWEGRKLDGFGALVPSAEKRDILGILFMSALFNDRAPVGGALFTVFLGGFRRPDIVGLDDSELAEIVKRECSDLLEIKNFNPDLLKIIRHDHAIPQYGVESGIRFDTISEIENEHKGLVIGGNLRNGIGMADRIQQGKNIAMLFKK